MKKRSPIHAYKRLLARDQDWDIIACGNKLGTIDPLTFCISADSQWVVCGFVNLDKMN